MILEIVDRLDIGRKFAGLSTSRFGFLSSGRTWAILKESGQLPSAKERLARVEMAGARKLEE